MKPIVRSEKWNADGTSKTYNPYGSAKADLVDELGAFCSFCDKHNTRSALHVEHIFGKKCVDIHGNLIYAHLEFDWNNFLLACVNCNSVKGNIDISQTHPYLPHINNLFCYIMVDKYGIISIKQGLTPAETLATQSYFNLTGIDRLPGDHLFSEKDDRWDVRLEVIDLANRQFNKYTSIIPTTDIDNIVDIAATTGHFIIWYNTFKPYDEILNALINGIFRDGDLFRPFPALDANSFDQANHFQILPRP